MRWTASEDQALFESDLGDEEIARMLGRTQKAVKTRRFFLRHGREKSATKTIKTPWEEGPDGVKVRRFIGV
jgi:hypothetical protein